MVPSVLLQLRALAYVHFCNNWFHYTMLAWLPTYFTDTLDLNLSQAAQARHLTMVALRCLHEHLQNEGLHTPPK